MSVNLVVNREFDSILDELRTIRDSDLEVKMIPDSILLRLHFLFPDNIVEALQLIEGHAVTLLQDIQFRREIFSVKGSSKGGDLEYNCYRYSNYCTCPDFLYRVMSQAKSVLCKHIIASRIAEATGTCDRRVEDHEMIGKLLENLGRPKERIYSEENCKSFERKELTDADKGIYDFGPSQPQIISDSASTEYPQSIKVKIGTILWIDSHSMTADEAGNPMIVKAPTQDEPLTQSTDLFLSQLLTTSPSKKEIIVKVEESL